MINRRPLRITNEDFIEKCTTIHKGLYNYSESKYDGTHYPFSFLCEKHGLKTMAAGKHLQGQGCDECGIEKAKITRAKTHADKFLKNFLERCSSIHGDKFDYSLVEYVNGYTEVKIICPKHGVMEIEPRHHVKGTGCLGCGRDQCAEKSRKDVTVSGLIEQFKEVHGDIFDYSSVNLDNYKGVGQTKIEIICKDHGSFFQRIRGHLEGSGCNKCRYFGYTRTAYIENCLKRGHDVSEYYIIKFYNENEEFYKLGITTQGIKVRYRKIKERGYYNMEIIYSIKLKPGEAWDTERKYKSSMIKYKYQPLNDFPGSTECFNMSLPIDDIINDLSSPLLNLS